MRVGCRFAHPDSGERVRLISELAPELQSSLIGSKRKALVAPLQAIVHSACTDVTT